MRAFWARHRKLHIWLAAELVWLGTFFAVRGNRAWMNALTARVTTPLRNALGAGCYRVSFSVMEALCAALAVFIVWYLVWSAAAIARARGRRCRRAYSAVLGAACVALTIYGGFCFLWGVAYGADSFQDRSGIRAEKVSAEGLTAVTQYFADRLNETAGLVERDGYGLFSVSRQEILSESPRAYDVLERQFPFLSFPDRPPKPVYFSRVMSRLDFTGIYCPYTGESSVNMDSPACLLPSTVAHELAHQRGVATEQECNFLSILACTTCGMDDYAYSGWLLGYIYLGNALYRADETAWKSVYGGLDPTVRADLENNNAYWRQFRSSSVKKVSNRVYDRFLKSYGETDGLQSYGTVVDLLVVYYQSRA